MQRHTMFMMRAGFGACQCGSDVVHALARSLDVALRARKPHRQSTDLGIAPGNLGLLCDACFVARRKLSMQGLDLLLEHAHAC
ncbi:hypothetical protein [Paraburkholderia bannensis]|uniref:hypothetical protein n=1 Tax=Paraburkholderia bannensis TaxID=765414 RepID=UPI0038BAA3CF